jgi:hypothetical protein
MTAFKITSPPGLAITLPLGLAVFIAGLDIGFSPIPLASSVLANCGSPFGWGTGILNTNIEMACAPIVAERNSWATALIFAGIGLLSSSLFLYRANRQPAETVSADGEVRKRAALGDNSAALGDIPAS